jgi:MSHA biogenesis protein MshJ
VKDELYQHTFRIEFLSDYFSTLQYLKSIEQLPWPIYWDTMDYKVQEYPKADITIKFHVLSIQKS